MGQLHNGQLHNARYRYVVDSLRYVVDIQRYTIDHLRYVGDIQPLYIFTTVILGNIVVN